MQEDGAHVGLEVDAGQVIRKRSDAGGRRRAYAGQRHQVARLRRHVAARGAHDARGPPQRKRPAVVAHSLPLLQDVGRVRRRKRVHAGKALAPALPAPVDAGHLGLLEHDLRYPYLVRIARSSPREVAVQLAAALEHLLPELRRHLRGWRRSRSRTRGRKRRGVAHGGTYRALGTSGTCGAGPSTSKPLPGVRAGCLCSQTTSYRLMESK